MIPKLTFFESIYFIVQKLKDPIIIFFSTSTKIVPGKAALKATHKNRMDAMVECIFHTGNVYTGKKFTSLV